MKKKFLNSFGTLEKVQLNGRSVAIYSLAAFELNAKFSLSSLPFSKRILLENLLRHEDGESVTRSDILALAQGTRGADREIQFHPARVLMPDSSGLPLLVDLASMRECALALGANIDTINPIIPIDIIVDHSVTTQFSGTSDAVIRNMELEYSNNEERYRFLKWAQGAFDQLRVVAPGNGIVHQINLEYLAQVMTTQERDGMTLAFPDSLVGMDSHTTMVNAMGVMGWGVGGIEAGSAMLGEPISMLIPPVVGCRLVGRLRAGTNATDVVLALTEALRRHGVVGKFVEFCGSGLKELTLPDRATISNMAPEYGATMGFFSVDMHTLNYMCMTGRSAEHVAQVEAYARMQQLWCSDVEPQYDELIEFDLAKIGANISGPGRPEDRCDLSDAPRNFRNTFKEKQLSGTAPANQTIKDGDIAVAAITSCTNTSNPSLMIAAGLLARNAVKAGLRSQPWVKTSLAPGSRRVAEYLKEAKLDTHLDALGFQVVGYGCMTCMGGSGELLPSVRQALETCNLALVAIISGNRNFDARIHPDIRANYLASPPLVVAYAIAGNILTDLTTQALGVGLDDKPVYLRDIWPNESEIQEVINQVVSPDLFVEGYAKLYNGDQFWNTLNADTEKLFSWDPESTYIRRSPYSDAMGSQTREKIEIHGARILLLLGDDVTTDHISPVGSTTPSSAVGKYLLDHGVKPKDFNLLLTRRSNPDVVARTAFSNVRLHNLMADGNEGGVTRYYPDEEIMDVFTAASRYLTDNVPLIVVAGKNYGMGSSRDTAAKGTYLLGIRAVIAESFERIHRSNLIGMGVLPLQFSSGTTHRSIGLTGQEVVEINVSQCEIQPGMPVQCRLTYKDNTTREVLLKLRVDTLTELHWLKAGGILSFVGNKLLSRAKPKKENLL